MAFSVRNKQHITQEELTALANCRSSQCIGIKDTDGKPKIVRVSRSDITCWQIFLRSMGLGKLADVRYDLSDVLKYLNEFDWTAVSTCDKDSIYYKAYLKACQIATKAIVNKGDDSLFNNVAKDKIDKRIKYSLYHGKELLNRMDVVKTIRWNPEMSYDALRALMERYFPNVKIIIESNDWDFEPAKKLLSKSELNKIKIVVKHCIPKYRAAPTLAERVLLPGVAVS
jgi:hypothetical protein